MVMRLSATLQQFLLIALKNLRSQTKSITSQTKLYIYSIHGFWLHKEEVSFVSSDDLDNIYILLDEDNDLEEEVTHLFNEVFLFSSVKKSITNQTLNIFKTSIVIRDNFDRSQVCFPVYQQYGLVCKNTLLNS